MRFGFFVSTASAAIAAALNPQMNAPAAMAVAADEVMQGLGRPLLIGELLGLITISVLNFYGASLTLLSAVDSFRPLKCTVSKRLASLAFATVAATTIALMSTAHFIDRFGDLLAILLYLFTPWTAINLVDFYLVRRGHYSVREIFNPRGLYGRWNWRGLLAYAVGFVTMIPFFSTGLYVGPVARALGGADIAMLVGPPISTVVYLIACRSMNLEREFRLAAAADKGRFSRASQVTSRIRSPPARSWNRFVGIEGRARKVRLRGDDTGMGKSTLKSVSYTNSFALDFLGWKRIYATPHAASAPVN